GRLAARVVDDLALQARIEPRILIILLDRRVLRRGWRVVGETLLGLRGAARQRGGGNQRGGGEQLSGHDTIPCEFLALIRRGKRRGGSKFLDTRFSNARKRLEPLGFLRVPGRFGGYFRVLCQPTTASGTLSVETK